MTPPTVFATDDQADHPVDTSRWASLAQGVLEAEGVSEHAELSMVFVDEQAIADLNRRYAGSPEPTDVLAFPIDDGLSHVAHPGPVLVGDVVICPAQATRNAAVHAGSYEDELALLVVHGVLHLLGMDHVEADEAEAMQRRERQLLGRLNPSPARAEP